jgi:hypothetical protein
MLWLERPPVLRWLGATVLVGFSLWSELAPPGGTPHTFLSRDIAAGTPLTADVVETRLVPDLGFETETPTGVAAVDLRAGDPLLAAAMTEVVVPDGWVMLEAPIPSHARAGSPAAALILPGEGESVTVELPAVVVATAPDDVFGVSAGTLAVPPEWFARAATAAAAERLVIGIGSDSG